MATVPEDAVATGDFTAREAGTVAGLRIAEAVLSIVCTDEFEVERHVEDGDRVEAGHEAAERHHPHPRPAHRRAQRTQPAVPAVGHRDRDPGLGRCPRGHEGARSATPARRRRGCAPWRSTRCAAAAASTTGCRCRTRPWSRTTTWSRRAASPRRSRPYGPSSPVCRSRWRSTRSTRSRRVLDEGADLILLDNFTPEQTREAVELVAGRAILESSGRLTLDNARAYARDRCRLPRGGRAHALLPDPRHRPRPARGHGQGPQGAADDAAREDR